MATATAQVLGDESFYTWSNGAETFTPGRLDWIVYSDSTARATNAFVLDTARFSDESLAKFKLLRTDSRATDHLPVVVDLTP